MNLLVLHPILVIGLFAISQGAEVGFRSYAGYQVVRASCADQQQFRALEKFYSQNDHLSGIYFWTEPTINSFTDILAAPEKIDELKVFLSSNGINYIVNIEDIGKVISEQHEARVKRSTKDSRMNWEEYQSIETIHTWLKNLARIYSEFVSIENIGTSTENRELLVLKISQNNGGNNTRPALWIDATIHAREWISTATISFIINELTTKSGQYQQYLSNIDFYFLPIVNPDGYAYTFATDRLWRKTRSNHGSPEGCLGVDANRNFGFHFGGPGSSPDKCSETYRGPSAYSEPEAAAVKDYILEGRAKNVKWDGYITLHSYGQLWLTPWGYTQDLPADYVELKRVGDLATATLKEYYGTEYRVGSSAGILYESSGSSRDWSFGEGGFKYSYTVELRDTGHHGFVLPPDQILATARETWAGLQVLIKNLI